MMFTVDIMGATRAAEAPHNIKFLQILIRREIYIYM